MNTPPPLLLKDLKTVTDETGMDEARVRFLRSIPEPQGNQSPDLIYDWCDANTVSPEVSRRLVRELLERLWPKTSRRRHDTGTGPIVGIGGGLTVETIRSGYGPCQRCNENGALCLVGDHWLCAEHARRQERRDRFRRMVEAAA